MSILESRAGSASTTPVRSTGALAKGWAFARLLRHASFIRKLGTVATVGYLSETGWVASVLRKSGTIDRERPLPWATFPYIAFIGARLKPTMRVFEFGAGSSTLYYAQRVAEVIAVEHDAAFFRRLEPLLPPNAQVRLAAARSESYLDAITEAGDEFDVVIVDGRDRVRCVAAAIPCLRSAGVVVLDDAEREEYAAGAERLLMAGFRRLDFWGLAPGVVGTKSTAVFYRDGNCLGL